MLPVRAILSRRIVTRPSSAAWARHNSTRPDSQEHNAPNKAQDPPVTENTIPLTAPSPAPPAPQPSVTLGSDPSTTSAPSPPASPSSTRESTSDTPDSWKNLSPYDLELVKQRIREWTDQAAVTFRERADGFTNQTKTKFSRLGAEMSKVTGYEEIEALKREVVQQEEKIKFTRQAAKQAKIAYEQAVIRRSESQREVNELLQRKSFWNDADLARFTHIVRQDHLYEQEETRAKAAVDETEAAVEREFTQLMKSILARYHEEQVWSDKIRSMSTYGSLAALGLNLLVFILAIVIVEPWKRRRLAQTFEAKIEELSVENAMKLEGSMKEIGEKFVEQENLLSKLLEEVSLLREIRTEVGGMQKVENEKPILPIQVPVSPGKPASVSIPGVPLTLPQRTFELAAVGVGAFVLGIITALLAD